ncbi:MAG: glycosyltransferase family 2 protein [Anaerolineae bacterium]|nr:glycosyltransferase family 2 protein [Anaerolineae bacterium]
MSDLVVIFVTWNVRELALEAIGSLLRDLESSNLGTEVVVVDSASTDGTVDAIKQRFPEVRVIASAENLGFGGANNLGMKALGFEGGHDASDLPEAVYLLNPDTITQPGATRALFDALMADAGVGLVGANLTYEDGSFQHGAFAFPGLRQLWVEFFPTPGRLYESRFNGRYPREWYARKTPFEIDFPLGATMMLRREVILQTGMFDEQFFMYCEEIDWAWRIHKAGWRVQCVPAAHVVHLSGQSTGQVRPQSVLNLWSSRLRLYKKHLPVWKWWLARLLIAVGMRRKRQQETASQAVKDAYRQVEQIALGRT